MISLTIYPPHATQVPQDDWGGYPGGGKDDEIPCRRMRSSSYVKAMGDEESGESDSSPKTSPQKLVRPDALVKAIIRPRDSQRYNRCNLKMSIVHSVWLFFFFLACPYLCIHFTSKVDGAKLNNSQSHFLFVSLILVFPKHYI